MPATRPQRFAAKLGLLLAATAACFLLLELATRLFADVEPTLARRHAVVGKTHIPGLRREVFNEESGRRVFLRFNREGFRGPDFAYEPTAGTYRIAVVGDSMVAAVEVDEADTAVAQLQRRLDASHPGRRSEVMSFGVAGASTGQELVLYREVVRRYRPDLVILVYFMGNDFSDNSSELSNNPRIYFELDEGGGLVRLPMSATTRTASVWLNENSRFYVWQKRALKRLRHDLGPRSGYRIFAAEPDDVLERAWRLNAALLASFRDAVTDDGARFVLVLCPAGAQVYDDVWDLVLARAGEAAAGYDRDHPRRRLAAIAAAAGVRVVDLTPGLRAARAETSAGRLYLAGGEGHLSVAGNGVVASQLHGVVVESWGGAGRSSP